MLIEHDRIIQLETRVVDLERQLVEARACDSDELMVSEFNEMRTQLAEAKAILSDLPDHSDLDAAVFEANTLRSQLAEARAFQQAFRDERDKAQRKLKEVGCAYASRKFSEAGRLIQELDRILSKEGE